ncbi:MAG: hypothetical protein ABI367_02180 [Mucilaginibacter sp.]
MGIINGQAVLKQLKADLIGKDSYRGVTLTYTWLANQFGHISLGFIPTILLYLILFHYRVTHHAAFYSALGISVTWLLFETYNFLGPLLLQKHSKSKVLFVPDKAYTFQPDWKNIAFDTITDLSFFWFGAVSASLLCGYAPGRMIILLVIVVALIYPCRYWYLTKMYLQVPQYPYQFRLAQWDHNLDDADRATIKQFIDGDENFHLFLFGARRCGKTSLGVGIATELSIKHQSAIYTTAMKLAPNFFESDQELLQDNANLWTWRDCGVLVIDDINPGDPVKPDPVSPTVFQQYIDTFVPENTANRQALAKLKTIWVMGSEDPEKTILVQWETMLHNIGVLPDKIISINLAAGG